MTSPRILVICGAMAFVTILSVNIFFASKEHKRELEIQSNRRLAEEVSSTEGKAFVQWDQSANPFPCVKDDSPDTQGLFYIKVPKTSSSTLAKITTRIAARQMKRQGGQSGELCKIYDPMIHHNAYELQTAKRNKSKSFLWTIIRHPSDRAISHFGMRVNFGQIKPTTDQFVKSLGEKEIFDANVEMKFLSPFVNPKEITESDYENVVQDILNEYNFIGTYERLYESLVVLTMLLDIDVTDVLFDYLPSKISRCGSLQKPSWVTTGMEDFLKAPFWQKREKGDYMLYNAIDKSLDLTIEKLGRENVQNKLEQYLKLLDIGTATGQTLMKNTGCGVPGLHPNQYPFSDLKDLFWFKKLSEEDKQYVSRPEFVTTV